ncbi:hypothetical protein A8C32_07340 [Flavivirga aquatica]|uniref:Uncharacterized protein n=1 Tax=Flavivirga aquatica TaxID=1849968 RepID=A0A1E5SIP1_9FLAO|nr:hypothetical protein [Flavivirga aquatica]OEJ98988.1 hypothetical protein A8C32_07340 [Flavivirga aquatica]
MTLFQRYAKFTPYLYFIAITGYWFIVVNKNEGITAYPILLFAVPFLWQLFKPNKKLNFVLGITFVCLSSYIILAYLSDIFNIISLSIQIKQFMFCGGIFVIVNFVMALWMIRNSLKENI